MFKHLFILSLFVLALQIEASVEKDGVRKPSSAAYSTALKK
jgi:hypothetical protein